MSMVTKEQVDAAGRTHEKARYLRGRFLNLVAVIERTIAFILTDYFCISDEEKRRLFFTEVVNGYFFSLNVKKDLLVKIVKKDYPRYWDDSRHILRNLNDIISFRNKLAHSVVDVSEQALARPIEEGVGFIEWREGEPITDAEFQDWEVKAGMVNDCLSDVKQLLPFKEKSEA
jgi:hypothetical protein